MGVDYSSNFGFGVKVDASNFKLPSTWLEKEGYEEEDQEDNSLLGEWLDSVLGEYGLGWFEIGSASYGGDAEYVVCDPSVKDDLDKGNYSMDLLSRANHITSTLEDLGIGWIGYPSIVGGLHIS